MTLHSAGDYAHFPVLPLSRGGSQDPHIQSMLVPPPLRQVISPQRQAVMATLPYETRSSMPHPEAVDAANNRMQALGGDKVAMTRAQVAQFYLDRAAKLAPWERTGDLSYSLENLAALEDWTFQDAKKTAGVLTTAEVYAAAKRHPDYDKLIARMEARRGGQDPDDVAPVGPQRACPKCGSADIRVREAHADTGMDEMEGICRKCDYRDDVDKFRAPSKAAGIDPAQVTPLDASPDGGENHPPLLSNPFMGDPKNAPEYENGYSYAQGLGHQQLNVATEGDVERWVRSGPAWVAGFGAGARSLGVGRLADTIEAYKPTAKLGTAMIDDLDDRFATEAVKTAGALLPLATTLGGAALGSMVGQSDLGKQTLGDIERYMPDVTTAAHQHTAWDGNVPEGAMVVDHTNDSSAWGGGMSHPVYEHQHSKPLMEGNDSGRVFVNLPGSNDSFRLHPGEAGAIAGGAAGLGLGLAANAGRKEEPKIATVLAVDGIPVDDTFATTALKTAGLERIMVPAIGAGLGSVVGGMAGGAHGDLFHNTVPEDVASGLHMDPATVDALNEHARQDAISSDTMLGRIGGAGVGAVGGVLATDALKAKSMNQPIVPWGPMRTA